MDTFRVKSHLVNVGVPVLVVLGSGRCAVDSGEEGGFGQVHERWVQTKRLCYGRLDPPADGSKQVKNKNDNYEKIRPEQRRSWVEY